MFTVPLLIVPANAQARPVGLPAPGLMAVLPLEQSASRGIITRDPSDVVKCKNEYWVFYTGRGVPSYHSKDLAHWVPGPAVFNTPPEWIAHTVPENRDMIYWAPDVMKVGDRYLLYYSVSSMGKMTSAIGLATNPTLDPNDPACHWTDQGPVVQSHEGGDFNTIDPALFQDDDGSLWLTFGSYWSGIKLVQLDPLTGKRLNPDAPLIPLAYNGSIEASYLCKHAGYYYLFVNWGACCQGPRSTYNIRIGRSKLITGPYLDKNGVDMLQHGGSLFLGHRGPLIGPGHAGTLVDQDKSWFTCDFEGDLRMGGQATLAISPLQWQADGWPQAVVQDRYAADLVPAGRFTKEVFSTNQYLGNLVYGPKVTDPKTGQPINLTMNMFLPPKEDAHARRPLVIFLHGGGFTAGTLGDEHLPWGTTCARLGYVAVSVSYRLSQKTDDNSLRLRRAVEDIRKAIKWLREHADDYGIDPFRIALEGCSAGGFAALSVAYDQPKGSYDLGIRAVGDMWGGMDTEKMEPTGAALCIIHGTADPLVPIAEAEKIRSRAAELGILCEYHPFEGYGHELKDANGKNRPAELSLPILTRFYAKHLAQVD